MGIASYVCVHGSMAAAVEGRCHLQCQTPRSPSRTDDKMAFIVCE